MHRDAQIIIIIGRNGTGKSTFCEHIVQHIKQRAVVVTYNGQPKIWRPYAEVDIRNPKKMAFKKGIRQVVAGRYEVSAKKKRGLQVPLQKLPGWPHHLRRLSRLYRRQYRPRPLLSPAPTGLSPPYARPFLCGTFAQ